MKKDEKIKVGISIGDLNGIGREVILKTFEDSRMLEFCTPIIFASIKAMSFFKKHFNSEINFHGVNDGDQIVDGKINVFNVWKENISIEFGKEDTKIGKYAVKSLEKATKNLKKAILMYWLQLQLINILFNQNILIFQDIQIILAKDLEGNSLMFMVTDELKVGLLTDHVPVKEVPQHITEDLIKEKIQTIYDSLIVDFKINKPKIAVLGINPHAGDNGVIGKEDDDILRPTLREN